MNPINSAKNRWDREIEKERETARKKEREKRRNVEQNVLRVRQNQSGSKHEII